MINQDFQHKVSNGLAYFGNTVGCKHYQIPANVTWSPSRWFYRTKTQSREKLIVCFPYLFWALSYFIFTNKHKNLYLSSIWKLLSRETNAEAIEITAESVIAFCVTRQERNADKKGFWIGSTRNIKVYLTQSVCLDEEWVQLAQDLSLTLVNLRVPYEEVNFLAR